MGHYSVATTKDQLSSLIDKALAGEEVVITRHGVPTVAMVLQAETRAPDVAVATERLRARVSGLAPMTVPVERFGDWLYEDEDG